MRTSHIKIDSLIREKKQTITDKELFASPAYAAYLTDIGDSMHKKHGKKIFVKTCWDERPGAFNARTDNRCISINCANFMTLSMPTRVLRALSIRGLHSHEEGHILFTSFSTHQTYISSIISGTLYPKEPTKLSETEAKALAELKELIASDDLAKKRALADVAHDIYNILEDEYIEERMGYEFPGCKFGIELNNQRFAEVVPSLTKQIKRGNPPLFIMQNILSQYCSTKTVNNLEEYKGPYLDLFMQCIPLVDSCVYTSNAKTRHDCVNKIMLQWWDCIKEYIEQVKEKYEDKLKKSKGSDGDGEMSDEEKEKLIKEAISELSDGKVRKSEMPDSKSAPVKGTYKPDKAEMSEAREKICEVIAESLPKLEITDPDAEPDTEGMSEAIERISDYKGSGYDKCADDIERMLTRMATTSVHSSLEREREKELTGIAEGIDYGYSGKGMKTTVYRRAIISPDDVERYNRIAPPLMKISREMQRRVSQVIKDQETGSKRSGLYMGRRFDVGSVVRGDGRIFYNRKAPCDNPKISVLILDDESGSMSNGDRATMARTTSIILYDFCRGLGIPVAIVGHSGDQVTKKSLELYSYADFDSIDNNDKYRLLDISARCQNRDGPALKFASEMIVKRPEEYKLLFVISDGEPCANNYGGPSAIREMQKIIKEYARKGVLTFGVAIGEDRKEIKMIYGEDFFLDVTNLNELPANITNLISKYIRLTA